MQEAAIPTDYETHGGQDVGIYARGPWAHLFDGTVEQNYIGHVMMYASCVGPYKTDCEERMQQQTMTCDAVTLQQNVKLAFLSFVILINKLKF